MTSTLAGGGTDSVAEAARPALRALPSLLAALDEHAAARPERTAVTASGRALSYGALHARVQRTAEFLSQSGVRPGQRVAVAGHKTPEAVAALLAVLRAGAAYVPLDPRAPVARWSDLVADAGCPLVLVSGFEAAQYAAEITARTAAAVVTFDEAAVHAGLPDPGTLPDVISPDLVAYCMYTSGSTGRPKGVQITHRALNAFFEAVHPLLEIGPDARCLNTSALTFDVSVVDLLYPLVHGATVHLSPLIPMPPLLVGTIERERITHMAGVGSTLTVIATATKCLAGRDISSLRRLMTGAEVLDPATIQCWLAAAPDLAVINGYGPTEATCLVTAYPITRREPGRSQPYPIGRPMSGVTVRFLDADGQLSVDGPGEILVAGDQVMLGYLARPEEQARAFLDADGLRFYRTGDIGRLDPDGDIRYEGRRDDEVKIRGYRVNTLEVRHALEGHEAVGRAFLGLTVDGRGVPVLACAIAPPDAPAVPHAGIPDDPLPALDPDVVRAVRSHVAGLLPGYMVPGDFRLLERVPVLASGKPDSAGIRRRLAAGGGTP